MSARAALCAHLVLAAVHLPSPHALAQEDAQEDAQAEVASDSSVAREPDPALFDDEARAHYAAAVSHFEVGRFEHAYREFAQALALSSRIELEYNLYLCAERLAQLPEALAHLRRFVDGADLTDAERRELEIRVNALAQRASPPPTPREPPLLEPAIADPLPARTPPMRVASRATWGGAAGLMAASLSVGAWTLRVDRDVAALCGRDVGSMCRGDEPELDRLQRLAGVATALGLAAVGAAVVALVLHLVASRRASEAR